eukprot:2718563-Rhodomonas_salina.4
MGRWSHIPGDRYDGLDGTVPRATGRRSGWRAPPSRTWSASPHRCTSPETAAAPLWYHTHTVCRVSTGPCAPVVPPCAASVPGRVPGVVPVCVLT